MKTLKFILLLIVFNSYSQQLKMRTLNELINTNEPAWPQVKLWIDSATNKVEILPKNKIKADTALFQTQVTTRSPMGSIIYETGGILIDDGWIRILGSGSSKLDRSVMDWNKNKSFIKIGEQTSFLLIADDVLGGFFAINAGGIEPVNIGKIYYFSPDQLTWENLNVSYTEFIMFCLNGDLSTFYKGLKWSTWKEDVLKIDGNQAFLCYPYLWSNEGKDINTVAKKVVPIQELWNLKIRN